MNTLQTIIAGEYQSWVDTDTVSVTFVRAGGSTTVANVTASKMNLRRAERFFGDITLTEFHKVWVLPDTLLAGNLPQQGDVIEDSSGTSWTIGPDLVRRVKLDTQWICGTVQQR